MKKELILATIAAVTLVGCSNSDVRTDIAEDEVEIGFKTSAIDNTTKATVGTNHGEMTATSGTTGTLNTDGNTMQVWGWKTYNSTETKVFDAQVVTYKASSTQTTTKWVYSPLKYWDRKASYAFYAVAPDDKFSIDDDKKFKAENVPAVQVLYDNAGANKIKLATAESAVTGTASTAIDYLVAGVVNCAAGESTQGNATDKDVAFTFNHILSKLSVQVLTTSDFNNTGDTKPQITLSKLTINIAGMCPTYTQKTSGTVTPSATAGDSWSGTASSATDYICYDVDGTKVASSLLLSTTAQEIASYLVAPTKTDATTPGTSTVTVSVEYTVSYSDGVNDKIVTDPVTVTALADKFVQNSSNALKITIAPKAIYFDVESVTGFPTDATEGAITVQ